jgi:hypothetical protein
MDVIAIQQAYEAAHSGKWDKAIKILRRALWKAKPDERDVLKKQLAQCLSGRAVKKAKSASFTIESVARVRQEIFPLAVDALLSGELTDETQQKYRKLIELAAHGPGSDKAAWRSKIVRYVAVSVVLGAVVVGLSLAIGVGRLRERVLWACHRLHRVRGRGAAFQLDRLVLLRDEQACYARPTVHGTWLSTAVPGVRRRGRL